MKKGKFWSIVAMSLFVAAAAKAFKSTFSPGSIYCFDSETAVVSGESCGAQNFSTHPHFKHDPQGWITRVCDETDLTYDGSVFGECIPITVFRFSSTGL